MKLNLLILLVCLSSISCDINMSKYHLWNWPMIFTHDSATGYLSSGVINDYAITQEGNFYCQLSSGARALDLRVELKSDKSLIFHHSTFNINKLVSDGLDEILSWAKYNKDPRDFTLLLFNHF